MSGKSRRKCGFLLQSIAERPGSFYGNKYLAQGRKGAAPPWNILEDTL